MVLLGLLASQHKQNGAPDAQRGASAGSPTGFDGFEDRAPVPGPGVSEASAAAGSPTRPTHSAGSNRSQTSLKSN